VKEFVCFSTTNVFVPVSQLSTQDLFYFLENLKIKQDIFFCLEFLVWLDYAINERYDSPIPDYFLEQKCSRKCEFLSIWGVFYKVNCGVDLGFLTHLFQKDV
jgi:hypothetical protein